MHEKHRSKRGGIQTVCHLNFIKNTLKYWCDTCWRLSDSGRTMTGARGFFGFVRSVLSGVSFVTRWRQSKIAGVLKFEHLIAPAGPSRVETSSKQLQTLGFGSDVGLQNLYQNKRGRRGMIPPCSFCSLWTVCWYLLSPFTCKLHIACKIQNILSCVHFHTTRGRTSEKTPGRVSNFVGC